MKNINRANRWVLNGMAFVILLLLLLTPLQLILLDQRIGIGLLFNIGNWFGLLVIVLTIVLYVMSFILVLWYGRLLLASITLVLTVIALGIYIPIFQKSSESGPRQLGIRLESGVKVYCNDVYLGQTLLEISDTEFHRKVKPWNTPPRQRMVIGEGFLQDIKKHGYEIANTQLRWFYTPYNYFDQPGFSSYDDAVASGYWWRFERNGCTGFASIQNMDSHSYSDKRPLKLWARPHLQYPSVQPHLRHLLHDLKHSNYRPSVEWRTHVGSSSGMLFEHLYEIGRRDSRVMRALEMAVKTEFGIREGMPAEDWELVLDKVMSQVRNEAAFHTLSPETMVMDLMRPHNMELIETSFLGRLPQTIDSQTPLGLGDTWGESVYGGGILRVPLEFRLLEYAVLKSSPPALFKRLVYESRRGERILSMVGSYSHPEALQLVRQYLNDFVHSNPVVIFISPSMKSVNRWGAVNLVTELRNSMLEPDLRRFVLKQAQDDPETSEHYLRSFINARLERLLTATEADSLAEWIAETVPLPEFDKFNLLTRINSERVYRYTRDIILRHPSYLHNLAYNFINYPNPSLDLFLIEAYQAESANVKFGGLVPITPPRKYLGNPRNLNTLLRGMLLCDTPKMRAFLERLWNSDYSNKILLLDAIKQEAPNHYPHLYRWTALISQIEDPDTRLAAIPALDQIDTPESSEILRDWALSSDDAVKHEAELALANYRERSRRAKELLAGNIKPDDLLVGQTAYVWNGKDYAPEVATGSK